MKPSFLQPLKITFDEISVKSLEQTEDTILITPKQFDDWKGIFFSGLHNYQIIDEEDRTVFKIQLTIEIPEKENDRVAYNLRVTIVGDFAVINEQGDYSEEELLDLVIVNGTSILYSTIKEKVAETTSRMRYGPMFMPGLNFMETRPSVQVAKDREEGVSRKKTSAKKTVTKNS